MALVAWLCASVLVVASVGANPTPGPPPPAPLSFDSEVVRLRVGGDSLEVEGLYRFLTRGGAHGSVPIFYPYPADARLGGARTVRVEFRRPRGAWREIAYEESNVPPGAYWRLPVGEGVRAEARVVYRQALRARYARYIVTTTSQWDRPLRAARFEITLPAGARAPRFSDPFRHAGNARSTRWVWEARDFRPAHDIEVEWEGPAPASRRR